MFLARLTTALTPPTSLLGDLGHLDGLRLSAGPGRFTTPGPTRPVASSGSAPSAFSAANKARFERHQKRVREQEEHDRRQRAADGYRDR